MTDYDLTWIVSKSLGKKWNAHFNLGYTWVGGADDVLHYGVAADYQLTDRVQLVAEVFADTTADDTAVQAGGGLRWQASEPVVLDAAVGAKLHGEAPDWTATVGLTWTLDFNRKERK
jgi:putative salt-induced outer membrane protein YdiY